MNTRIKAVLLFLLLPFVTATIAHAADHPPMANSPFKAQQARQLQQQWAKHIGKPVVETNSIGMKLTLIPPGEFLMGSTEAQMRYELERMKAEGSKYYEGVAAGRSIETPAHRVRITKPFYMASTEVTVGQFRQFVEATGYKTEAERGWVYGTPTKSKKPLRTWQKHLFKQTEKHPALQLCQRDCWEFCKWLSKKEGREYIIPTEAQWEYACRAGTESVWYFADPADYDKVYKDFAWMSWDRKQTPSPVPVGGYKPNAFGLYDMHGNVWEYVSDWYHEFYYKETPLNDPTGPSTFNEMRDGRVMIRGGSFDWGDYGARAALRMRIRQDSNQHPHMGFRVALKTKDAPGIPPLVDNTPSVRKDSDPQAVQTVDAVKAQQAATTAKMPKEMKVEISKGVSIDFVLIPAGTYLMGAADGLRDEKPLHKVTISKPFYIGKYEITQGQWETLFPKDERFVNWRKNPRLAKMLAPNKPMTGLDWHDSRKFIAAVQNKLPGNKFRLPTEAEWEYACRAGSRSAYHFGDDMAKLGDYATFCTLDALHFREREPVDLTVGIRKPNAWGLHDMHGGLWEWTADLYGHDYYVESPVKDPQGPDAGLMRVLRGGSFFRYGKYARSAFRLGGHPDGSSSDYGMRLVMTLAEGKTSQVNKPSVKKNAATRNTPPLAKAPFDAKQAQNFQQQWAKHIGKELVHTNSVGMQLKLIPPGEYMMGMTQSQVDKMMAVMNADEKLRQWAGGKLTWAELMMPAHRVRITKPFYLGTTEVTVGQYRKFVEATGHVTGIEAKISEGKARSWEKYTWKNPVRKPAHDNKPVVQVSWEDCQAFCKWLSKKEGVEYYLPTEAQWEYACRAGTTTLWSFGSFKEFDFDKGQHVRVGKGEEDTKKGQRIVAQGKPNAFGLYDMHGNVWEFVGDYWHRLTYKESPLNDPTGPAMQSEKGDSRRIIRGGSYDFGGINTASPYRMRIAQTSFGHHHSSFRIAMRIKGAKGAPPAVDPDVARRATKRDPGANSAEVVAALKAGATKSKPAKELMIDIGKGVKMDFVLIPAGTFLMGGSKGPKDERPIHRVVVSKPFYMAKYELTQTQWEALMGKNPRLEEYRKHDTEMTGPTKAMNDISWVDCQSFIGKLKKKAPGNAFALPTEAQWEYACRAGSTTEYHFGDNAAKLGDYAWYEGNMNWVGKPNFGGRGFYHDVGKKKPNAYGLYDMHGGVWEWCADWYDSDYYYSSPLVNPTGPKTGRSRVLRGGSWFRYPQYARSAYRRPFNPQISSDGVTAWVVDFGCRLVINLNDAVKTTAVSTTNKQPSKAPTKTKQANKTPTKAKQPNTTPKKNKQPSKTPPRKPVVSTPPPPAKVPFGEDQARHFQRLWAKHLGKEVVETNAVGMKMVLVPAGEYRQAASKSELDAITRDINKSKGNAGMKKWYIDHIVPNEGPDHAVRITKPYRISATEVTVAQFRKFVEATGYKTDADREELNPNNKQPRRTWKTNHLFKNQKENQPVLEVSWHDAMAFCGWLGKKDGRIYRMPTEAEWEFAARSGSAGRWCFGNDLSKLGQYAWYSDNSGDKPQPVGTKKPNAFGLYDMHGNMFEYTSDFFADQDFEQRFGPKQPVALDPTGIKWGYRVALRGGSFDSHWFLSRVTSRLGGAGRYQHHYHMGFRVVMVIGDEGPTGTVNTSLTGRRTRGAHPVTPLPAKFVKHKSNPVLEIESNGVECRSSFSLTRMDDVWYLWHAAKPPGIDRAVSVDGIHWTQPATKPRRGLGALFVSGRPMKWDDLEVAMPYVVRSNDYHLQRDVLMMYYSGAGKSGGSGMGYASFLVGAPGTWYRQGLNPVLRGPIFHPCVVPTGQAFTMWCVKGVGGKNRICRSTSPDGARWTPVNMNPVLPLGKPGEFDSQGHNMPRVLLMGRTLVMWYLGNDGKTTRLGMATSTDGVRWTKSKANPVLDVGGKNDWDSGSIVAHDVQWHDDQYQIWYAAHAGQHGKTIRIGCATAKPVEEKPVVAVVPKKQPPRKNPPPNKPAASQKKPAIPRKTTPQKKVLKVKKTVAKKTPPLALAPFTAQQAKSFQQQWATHIGKEPVHTNSIGMKLQLIPPGQYTMGRTKEQFDKLLKAPRKKAPNPARIATWEMLMMPGHSVRITKPFYMASTEVTVGQYRQFCKESGYKTEAERGLDKGVPYKGRRPICTWQKPMVWIKLQQKEDEPVLHLCWNDCVAFCKWLSKKEGVEYCLPTEAEWEYACRAGTTTAWSFGNFGEFDRLGHEYMFVSDGKQGKHNRPSRVGLKKPNAFGLYDMHGNMWEYVADWWHRFSYKNSLINDPTGPPEQSEKGDMRRVIRTGSFDWGRWGAQSVYRMRIGQRSTQHPHQGFRVAMRLKGVEGVAPAVEPFDQRRKKTIDPGPQKVDTAAADKHPKELTLNLPGGVKMDFVLIRPGSYLMGSSNGFGDETPVHRVVITKPFYMAKYETTTSQWAAVMGKDDRFKFWESMKGEFDDAFGPTKAMRDVSWDECQNFVAALQKKVAGSLPKPAGHKFALPTEAQWEYACRAGSTTEFHFGDDPKKLGDYAWHAGNMRWPGGGRTFADGSPFKGVFYHAVGMKKPNTLGLYDMHGGVWEWCRDYYDKDYYLNSPLKDPTGPKSGWLRTLRGGSWFRYAKYCRSAYRRFFYPASNGDGVTAYISDFGCRVVIELPESPAATKSSSTNRPSVDQPPIAKAPFNAQQAKAFQQQWAKHIDRPLVQTNSIGMKFTLLPPGEFRMGVSEEEEYHTLRQNMLKSKSILESNPPKYGSLLGEMPAHRVRLTKPFYMGSHEVTFGQFRQFADETGYKTDAERGLVYNKPYEGKNPIRTWRKPVYPDRPSNQQQSKENDPVMHIDWNDCMAFCEWLSKKEAKQGHVYSLPTSAQWEYACRGGTTTVWHFGNEEEFNKIGHEYEYISWGGKSPKTIGLRKPNPFGLYDMHGNMMEWVLDWQHDDYYLESPLNDPVGPGIMNEERNRRRMVRGGAFEVGRYWSRSAWSVRIAQGSNQHRHPGFRVAMHIKGVNGVATVPEPNMQPVRKKDTRPVVTKTATKKYPNNLKVDLGNGSNIEFVLVPAGSFMMGSLKGGRYERPLHEVIISKPFYIGKYEVTQQQYDAVMGVKDREKRWGKYTPVKYRPMLVGPNKAMYYLNWNDWQEFIEKTRNKLSGHQFSLPTEAQWEYACRAGSTTEFCYGDDPSLLQEYASIYPDDAPRWRDRKDIDFTVGIRKPNNWGIHDMHGNVREWCTDWWDKDYYATSPLVDPQGPDSGNFKVMRGGSIRHYGRFARSAFRFRMQEDLQEWGKSHMSGARLVINLP